MDKSRDIPLWEPAGDGLTLRLKGYPIEIRRMTERRGEYCFGLVIDGSLSKGVYNTLGMAKMDGLRVATELDEFAG